jgi:hypothetical protein
LASQFTLAGLTRQAILQQPGWGGTLLEAEGEQFDGSHPKDQDYKCHRIVFEPNTHNPPPFCFIELSNARGSGYLHRNVGNRTMFQTFQKKLYGCDQPTRYFDCTWSRKANAFWAIWARRQCRGRFSGRPPAQQPRAGTIVSPGLGKRCVSWPSTGTRQFKP